VNSLDQHIDAIDATVRVQLAQRRSRNNDGNDRGGRGGMKNFVSFHLYFDEILCKKVIVVAEVIGIITIPVKVLTPVVAVVAAVNGVVPEEVFPIIKVVVFVVSNSRERTNNFSIQNFL
jgi:hypothetical protein